MFCTKFLGTQSWTLYLFDNFAFELAARFRSMTQKGMVQMFQTFYDKVQGAGMDLFNPDTNPMSKADAARDVFDVELNKENDHEQKDENDVGNDTGDGETGEPGSSADDRSGGETSQGNGNAESDGGTAGREQLTKLTDTIEDDGKQGTKVIEGNNDEQRGADSGRVADDATGSVEKNRNGSNLRVFKEGLDSSYREYTNDSERTRRAGESERLVTTAKQNGTFIPISETQGYGDKISKRTGESVVYVNAKDGRVYKVKDPYAKSAMKTGVQPEDAILEYLVYNIFFPETAYTLEGVSEDMGDVRIILSQKYISSAGKPTKEQITKALAERGLFPEDDYSFGNEYVSVTDVEGDNVLLGKYGKVYFIDPIIRFKKPLIEILGSKITSETVAETDVPKTDNAASKEETEENRQQEGLQGLQEEVHATAQAYEIEKRIHATVFPLSNFIALVDEYNSMSDKEKGDMVHGFSRLVSRYLKELTDEELEKAKEYVLSKNWKTTDYNFKGKLEEESQRREATPEMWRSQEDTNKKALREAQKIANSLKDDICSGDRARFNNAANMIAKTLLSNNRGHADAVKIYSAHKEWEKTVKKNKNERAYKLTHATVVAYKKVVKTLEDSLNKRLKDAGIDGVKLTYKDSYFRIESEPDGKYEKVIPYIINRDIFELTEPDQLY